MAGGGNENATRDPQLRNSKHMGSVNHVRSFHRVPTALFVTTAWRSVGPWIPVAGELKEILTGDSSVLASRKPRKYPYPEYPSIQQAMEKWGEMGANTSWKSMKMFQQERKWGEMGERWGEMGEKWDTPRQLPVPFFLKVTNFPTGR